MNSEFLARLIQADPADRHWLLLESMLDDLSLEMRQAVWSIAVPHWFDDRILAALCPELATQAVEIYQELQALSFVEVFEERGHNIHEVTRSVLLDRLWSDRPEEFKLISSRASEYFTDDKENVAEWLYHKAVGGPIGDALDNVMLPLNNKLRRSESEMILKVLREQLKASHMDIKTAASISYSHNKLYQRLEQPDSIWTHARVTISKYLSDFNLSKLIFQLLSSIVVSFAAITLIYVAYQVPNILFMGFRSIILILVTLGLIYAVYYIDNKLSVSSGRRHNPYVSLSKTFVKLLFLGFVGFNISIFLFAAFGQNSTVELLIQIWKESWKPIVTMALAMLLSGSIEETFEDSSSHPQHRSITRSMLETIKDSIYTKKR